MARYIKHNQDTLGIIVSSDMQLEQDSINFVTPNDSSLQVGVMSRCKGYLVKPHIHKSVKRVIYQTQEVLFIKSGTCLVTFYSEERDVVERIEVHAGDVVMFVGGGHSIEMLEDVEIIEVKQGPYLGELDKDRFDI